MSLFDKVFKKKDPFDSLGNDPFKSSSDSFSKNDSSSNPDPFSSNNSEDPFSNNNLHPKLDEADPNEMSMSSPHPNNVPQNLPGQHAGQQEQTNSTNQHQIELILSKLDTIKLNIDNINLRISRIENDLQKKEKTW